MDRSPFSASYVSPTATVAPENLRAVTLAQLRKSTSVNGIWTFESGVAFHKFYVVALVTTIEDGHTCTVFDLSDGTGECMAGAKWNNDGVKCSAERGRYASIVGTLKVQDERKLINVISIRAVQDPHEIYFHTLSAMREFTLDAERRIDSENLSGTDPLRSVGDFVAANALENALLKAIADYGDEGDGVFVGELAVAVSHVSRNALEISDALDTMMERGLIYNTTDVSHFLLAPM